MNGIGVINGAIARINKQGLARGTAIDSEGRICPAAALVEAAGADKDLKGGRFYEAAYLEARGALTSVLGISDSYQAITEWNDRVKDKGGKPVYRQKQEVVAALARAIKKLAEEAQEAA